ncbi:MAG: SusC/RagA family TonB-linked outer membrane protein [Candidatus Symbiothrix sp.]|jgi:TonB-linked SusC/RagA family outer membrane protein|nr:SusC/RagA family TonB-linked outer membrane protein [Candidatus Symbiothrix sp.]
MKIHLLFLFLQLSIAPLLFGQSIADPINIELQNQTLSDALNTIAKKSGFGISYTMDQVEKYDHISIEPRDRTVNEILDLILVNTNLTYIIQNRNILIVNRDQKIDTPKVVPVQGTVRDTDNEPVAGVSVYTKSKSNGTSTDKDGNYTLDVTNGSVLVFSIIGYKTVEALIDGQIRQDVVLQNSLFELDEVIISTGYQELKKEKMTGATVSVSAIELNARYTPNVLDNLEGHIAGLVNYGGKTMVRGTSSLHASTSPLTVVDGLPFEGGIASLNPYDIENITVLKDAAATAIYGARASNGVLVITTKQAKEKGKTTVDISGNITVYQKPDYSKRNILTPAQQVDVESSYYDYYFNGGVIANPISSVADFITKGNAISPVQYAYYQLAQGLISQTELDSQLNAFRKNDFARQFKDNALRNSILQQYNISIRNKGEKLQSSLVLNFKTDNEGIISDHSNQFNFFYKGSYDVSKWLSINYGINSILTKSTSSNSNFATSPFNVSPYMRLLDENGNRVYYTTSVYNPYNTLTETTPELQNMLVNHLDELELDKINASSQSSRYYVNMNIKIIEGLDFNPQFQYESGRSNTLAYSEAESFIMRYIKNIYTSRTGTNPDYTYSYLLPANGGKLATTNSENDSWTARGQFNYSRIFGKHAIDLIAGTEFRQTHTKGTRGLLLGYDDQLQSHATTSVNYTALSAVTSTTFFKPSFNPSGIYSSYLSDPIGVITETTHRFNSGYANATYTYDRRYNVFASYRKDYADVFGLDKKFRGKPLWSTGLGWNVHHENFLYDIQWINFLKFRATYGVTGNMYMGATSYLTANSSLTNAATKLPVSVVESPANPELRWEKSTTVNLGIDFALFNNRLNGSFDWYRKRGEDIFSTTRIDPSEGFTSQILNNGNILNNGIETSLKYGWFRSRKDGVNWSTSVIVSYNKNKITYVDNVTTTPLALAQGGLKVNYPVNSLFSFQYKGLDEKGQPQWLKGDGSLTTIALDGTDLDAVVYSGGSDPDVNIGMINDIRYKGFSLNMLLVYYGGHYLRAQQPSAIQSPPYGTIPSYVLDSWTPEHTNTIIPGFGQYTPAGAVPGSYLQYSDAFVHSGTFLKIRDIVLGYDLPQNLTKKTSLSHVNVNLQVNRLNALWVKNKINIDPETGDVPEQTFFVFGINFNL